MRPEPSTTVTAQETTVLYVLSTLAQTCAALAAFVGAVGLYRLQSLRDRRRDVEHELRVLAGRLTGREWDRIPWREVPGIIEAQRKPDNKDPNALTAIELLDGFETFKPRLRSSRSALFTFEGWNLAVIAASLVGFNHVSWLASWPWAPLAVWAVGLGTVGATGWSVFTWTRE